MNLLSRQLNQHEQKQVYHRINEKQEPQLARLHRPYSPQKLETAEEREKAKVLRNVDCTCHCGDVHYSKLPGCDLVACTSCSKCLVGKHLPCNSYKDWTCVHCRAM
jgi:hypothetical protein